LLVKIFEDEQDEENYIKYLQLGLDKHSVKCFKIAYEYSKSHDEDTSELSKGIFSWDLKSRYCEELADFFHEHGDYENEFKTREFFDDKDEYEELYAYNHCKIGELYFYGGGVDIDKDKALDYFKEAEKLGVPYAYLCLGVLYHDDTAPETYDDKKAHEYMELAYSDGEEAAGEYLKEWYGISHDLKDEQPEQENGPFQRFRG
jgi:TPR repeat protein